jgi:allantoinase
LFKGVFCFSICSILLFKVGFDADFTIWDPLESFTINESTIFHKNKVTPYLGWKIQGVVHKTIVGGKTVFENGQVSEKPLGSLIINQNMRIPTSSL